jgi:hypothetical protein
VIYREFDLWLDPELCLTRWAMHMNVHPRLLAREKVEAEAAFSKNSRTQPYPPFLSDSLLKTR